MPSFQNCSRLLSHIFRLIIVALGYLAGALGDCSGGVSHVLLRPRDATSGLESFVLLFSCLPAVRCSGVFALTRVCERDLQSVVVAEAFADRRDDGLCRSISSASVSPCAFFQRLLAKACHTTIRGPKLPMTKLQRMAGLWRAAQLMYWRGAAQKVTGAIVGCGVYLRWLGRYWGCEGGVVVVLLVVEVCSGAPMLADALA